ncbi:MAG: RIP metalloprotease RseP, partial [Muribaculaceae bacterium]|nr:RIP metalloprotease RseP [Muribaculaceae bacterium]
METFWIKAAQLVLALAILIIIHEFGHFLFARLFGIRVEKFYIFFDPWKEIFKWKPGKYIGGLGKQKDLTKRNDVAEDPDQEGDSDRKGKKTGFWNDTEYGIGWVPLGGYCKISGMIDESMDTEQMKQPAKPYEFRSKPAWQRLLVMIAGVLFNFLLAILIYAGIVYATGEKYVALNDAKMGLQYSQAAINAGFRNGDIPIEADGEALDGLPSEDRLKMMQAKEVKVLRDGNVASISIPENFIFDLDKEMKSDSATVNFFTYRIPTRITQVMPGEGASKAGVKEGDEVIAINGVSTPALTDFLSTLEGHDNETIDLTVVRKPTETENDTLTLPVKLSANSKMGVGLEIDPSAFFNVKEKKYNIFTSIPRGIEMGVDRLTSYAKSMKLVFTKEGAKSVGGFGAIGSIFPESWDWIAFWNIAAFLSVALAFMNILPIPALDGGHVLFLLYEVIFRRKPSEKFMEYAQMTGMVLLISLLIYANGMDIV